MAYSTIPKGSLYMNTKLYTGNGGTQTISGIGFQPDLVWGKGRTSTEHHQLYDAVRLATKVIYSNETDVQATKSTGLTAFNSDGFVLGSDDGLNKNSISQVAWNWKAGGGQGSSNTAGSINTTYTSVNTTSGFSISQYTGTGSAGATVGHGLGVAPKMIIVKGLTYADVWLVGGDSLGGWNKEMYLNGANTVATNNNAFNGVAPTSSVFTLGSGNGTNKSGDTYIAYCFADVKGFSKMISYKGNSSTDGTFVYCGFKPAFILTKATATGEGWQIYDNKRLGFNATEKVLYPNTSSSESTLTGGVDFLSNGFKWRTGDGGVNSGQLYACMAFAENPFVATSGTSAIPVTAK